VLLSNADAHACGWKRLAIAQSTTVWCDLVSHISDQLASCGSLAWCVLTQVTTRALATLYALCHTDVRGGGAADVVAAGGLACKLGLGVSRRTSSSVVVRHLTLCGKRQADLVDSSEVIG
jgi:hypothetical protein